jgi:hypothetical protein
MHSVDNQPERLADLPPIFRSTFTTKWNLRSTSVQTNLEINWREPSKSRLATTGATQALARNSHGRNLRSPEQARSTAPPNRTAGASDPMLPGTHVVDLPDPHVTGLPEPQTCSTAVRRLPGTHVVDLPDPHVTGLPEPQTCSTAVRRISCTVVHQEPKNHGWSFISPALPFTGFDTVISRSTTSKPAEPISALQTRDLQKCPYRRSKRHSKSPAVTTVVGPHPVTVELAPPCPPVKKAMCCLTLNWFVKKKSYLVAALGGVLYSGTG